MRVQHRPSYHQYLVYKTNVPKFTFHKFEFEKSQISQKVKYNIFIWNKQLRYLLKLALTPTNHISILYVNYYMYDQAN